MAILEIKEVVMNFPTLGGGLIGGDPTLNRVLFVPNLQLPVMLGFYDVPRKAVFRVERLGVTMRGGMPAGQYLWTLGWAGQRVPGCDATWRLFLSNGSRLGIESELPGSFEIPMDLGPWFVPAGMFGVLHWATADAVGTMPPGYGGGAILPNPTIGGDQSTLSNSFGRTFWRLLGTLFSEDDEVVRAARAA